jgi:hypothetical protein
MESPPFIRAYELGHVYLGGRVRRVCDHGPAASRHRTEGKGVGESIFRCRGARRGRDRLR